MATVVTTSLPIKINHQIELLAVCVALLRLDFLKNQAKCFVNNLTARMNSLFSA